MSAVRALPQTRAHAQVTGMVRRAMCAAADGRRLTVPHLSAVWDATTECAVHQTRATVIHTGLETRAGLRGLSLL